MLIPAWRRVFAGGTRRAAATPHAPKNL